MSPPPRTLRTVVDAPDANGPVTLPGPLVFNVDFPGQVRTRRPVGPALPQAGQGAGGLPGGNNSPRGLADRADELRSRVREIRRFVEFAAASMPEYGDALQLDDLRT